MGGKNTNPTTVKTPPKDKRTLWDKIKSIGGNNKAPKTDGTPKTDGRQRSGDKDKPSPPPKMEQPNLEQERARQAWEKKKSDAEKRLNELNQRPLRDGRRPAAILQTATDFANGKMKDRYEKATTLLEKDFNPALDLAEQNGLKLENLRNEVEQEIVTIGQDTQKFGKSEALTNFLSQTKAKLDNAKTAQDITKVRKELRRAPLFRPIPDGEKQ